MNRHLLATLAAIGVVGILAIALGRLRGGIEESPSSVQVEVETADAEAAREDCVSVEEVRALATGAEDREVDARLCDVTVIRTTAHGYFVQASPDGPAIQVFDGSQLAVSPGDRVSMRVVEVTEYEGNQEITAIEELNVEAAGIELDAFVRDLSGGVVPGENLEAGRVNVRGARVVSIDGRDARLDYGAASGVPLWLHPTGAEQLCVGAVVDVSAVVTEDTGDHRLSTFDDGDLEAIDATRCALEGEPASNGNLVVLELLALPPGGADGDANCDGRSDASEDAFIELLNTGTAPILLAGVTVNGGEGPTYTFPAAARLAPGEVALLYAGGAPACPWPPGARPFASAGLEFASEGGVLRVIGATGDRIAEVSYASPASTGGSSLLRVPAPEARDAAAYRPHASVAPDGRPYSAGRQMDGSSFATR